MMHPDLNEPVFAEWYGSPDLLAAVEQLLHASHDDLQLGNFLGFMFRLFLTFPTSFRIVQPSD